MARAARALGPPRLAAGAGDRYSETPKDFYDLGFLGAFSRHLFLASEALTSQTFAQSLVSSSWQYATPLGWNPLPHFWGHFPFPREKGSEKGSCQSVAGMDRKPDLLQMSGFKSGLCARVCLPPPCAQGGVCRGSRTCLLASGGGLGLVCPRLATPWPRAAAKKCESKEVG